MNLTEMVDAIVEETRLQVQKNQITRRVRDAITSIHSTAFYTDDLQEDFVLLGLRNPHTNVQIPLPPLYRKFKCIKPMTALRTPVRISTKNNQYRATTPTGVSNFYGEQDVDFYYVAGNIANISSSCAPQALYLSWYGKPEVADPLLETWIMRDYPQFVMDWAVARFWKRNGKESIARDMERSLYSVDLQNLINNHATDVEI